jgi:hypothetical protein
VLAGLPGVVAHRARQLLNHYGTLFPTCVGGRRTRPFRRLVSEPLLRHVEPIYPGALTRKENRACR